MDMVVHAHPIGDGIHEYIFTIHALKVPAFKLTKDANPAMVGFFFLLKRHIDYSVVYLALSRELGVTMSQLFKWRKEYLEFGSVSF